MSQINDRLRSVQGCHFGFYCPGCEEMHYVGASWGFDGNLEAPTITPSLLVTSGHYSPSFQAGSPCWCTYNAEHPDEPRAFMCERCHSFIRAGDIQFRSDCTHELAGKTVPIPPLPAHLRDEAPTP
jgi:hypothetical protein